MTKGHVLIAAGLMLAAQLACADNEFRVPRECNERQNVKSEKCVIQDGPPRAPRVQRMPLGTQTSQAAAPVASAQVPDQAPSTPARTKTQR